MRLEFPDGKSSEFPAGTLVRETLADVATAVAGDPVLGLRVGADVYDLGTALTHGGRAVPITPASPDALEILRHSASHLMAQAVTDLFPGVEVGVGPATESGFYYDFKKDEPFTPEDLEKIEARMRELVRADFPIVRKVVPRQEALAVFEKRGQKLKVELISDKGGESVSCYEQRDFVDFCLGPHLPSTGHIKAIKLLSVAACYWKGDERNVSMQRIYGTAFYDEKSLQEHLTLLEEAKKRDHRRLGPQLDLFSIEDQNVGAGLILWHPKGARVRMIAEDFLKGELLKNGYEPVYTPHIARLNLWKTSGHTEFFRENMFAPIDMDEMQYQLKPMNCPFHVTIYKSRLHSYRDLPIRLCEFGTVYRYERSGVLHGLLRVRGFTQDDAHIFCRPDDLDAEIQRLVDFTFFMLKSFGFEAFEIYLSTRPEKFIGTIENWDRATAALRKALETRQLDYTVEEGGGAFYGPKIDVKIKDVINRAWQCTTIQVDFNLPERFNISYMGEDGNHHTPIMIHRALLGSIERFMGVLIEHYGGAFPIWLAPVQAIVLPITDRAVAYAQTVKETLQSENLRVTVDSRNEKIGYKIREAQNQKIPYMLVVGDREAEKGVVSVRNRFSGDLGARSLPDFIAEIKKHIADKSPRP
ncbi:MAG: threonine--tRNA ligase [Acidobacteria bacterium]|nr:threonine--tRNA ligase [Acidobacteriota bacterium]